MLTALRSDVSCALWLLLLGSLWLCGCTTSLHANRTTSESLEDEPVRMQVLAAVLREIGKPEKEGGVCWLALSDSEFARIRQEFEVKPPRFSYAQLKEIKHVPTGGYLSVRHIQIKAQVAEARITFRDRFSFADYLYKLVREGENWKVVESEFVCAS